MTIYGFDIPDVIIGIVFGVALAVIADRAASAEENKDESFPAPSRHKVAWHIVHARQDIRLVGLLLFAILITLWIKL